MTPTDAYNLTLEKIKELEHSGIDVQIKPSKSAATSKYGNSNERLPYELWQHVTFKVKDDSDAERIREAANYLGMAGITFDTGGSKDTRDWELDWSFKYTQGKPESNSSIEARDLVEMVIAESKKNSKGFFAKIMDWLNGEI